MPPDDLSILFQAKPSLEHLQLHFQSVPTAHGIMDDILFRIFNSPPNNSTISSEEASHPSFLPCLQFMECMPFLTMCALFFWNHIPQLYRRGHRRLLALKSAAKESHISDDTALQLLKLTNEGVDLQIFDRTTEEGGNFLENFRKRYGKPDSQARFWNGMSRPSVSVCDAVVRDLEHYSFKVQMVWVNLCKHQALCGGVLRLQRYCLSTDDNLNSLGEV